MRYLQTQRNPFNNKYLYWTAEFRIDKFTQQQITWNQRRYLLEVSYKPNLLSKRNNAELAASRTHQPYARVTLRATLRTLHYGWTSQALRMCCGHTERYVTLPLPPDAAITWTRSYVIYFSKLPRTLSFYFLHCRLMCSTMNLHVMVIIIFVF